MPKKKRGGGGSHRFYSQKQWRWAFATKQPWARRHARRTPGGKIVRYRALPKSKHSGKRGGRRRRR